MKFGAVLTGLDSKILETSGRSEMTTKTLYDKIVDLHTIEKLSADGIERLVYIDRTVVNEYTSPQAFSLLRENGLKVWRPWATLGTVDHVNSSAPDRTEFPAEENAC
ncbi:3-isopropylmalate dehydratase large subunit, partial [Phocaeicola vulgatus]